MTEITHERAVEIDTQLAQLWSQTNALSDKIDLYKRSLASTVGLKGEWGKGAERGHLVYHRYSLAEVIETAEVKIADDSLPRYEVERVEGYLDKITEAQDERKAVRALAAPLEAIYEEHRWRRFFLVTNQNGHIHSSMNCHTCNPRTLFAWLPELSGLTEKEAVEAHGTILCSHCFPTAPVEWTLGRQVEADPDQCPGSGTYEHTDFRRTSYSGAGRATCNHCHHTVSVTTSGKMRKHKKEA